MKPSKRKYTGASQFFHNYEHSHEGLTHCRGPASNPYRIVHRKGKHTISTKYAKGHGKNKKTQWFEFGSRTGLGWDLASGTKVAPKDVPARGKKKTYFKLNDKALVADEMKLKGKLPHEVIKDRLKRLPPRKVGDVYKLPKKAVQAGRGYSARVA